MNFRLDLKWFIYLDYYSKIDFPLCLASLMSFSCLCATEATKSIYNLTEHCLNQERAFKNVFLTHFEYVKSP